MRRFLPLLLLTACSRAPEPFETGLDTVDCAYPDYADPMALGRALGPYKWPTALHADGRSIELDLRNVHCDTDEIIDWSIHELLLFVSVPAW